MVRMWAGKGTQTTLAKQSLYSAQVVQHCVEHVLHSVLPGLGLLQLVGHRESSESWVDFLGDEEEGIERDTVTTCVNEIVCTCSMCIQWHANYQIS